jgi:Chitin binding Peritrophin-A domain
VLPDDLPNIPDQIFIDCEDATSGLTFPHPESCSFYFFCSENKSYLHMCGEGLVFDILSLKCQRPENAQCVIQDSTVMTTEETTNETTEITTDDTTHNTTEVTDEQTPEDTTEATTEETPEDTTEVTTEETPEQR